MTTRIHLDTDIGGDIDDLCALVMLLGWPEVELTGVTTSAEDGGRRAGLARYVLDLAGRDDIPVAAGAAGSLAGFPTPPGIADPLRYWPDPVPPRPGSPGAALDLLAESIRSGATVVAIGPFTNLALLEATQPGLLASTTVVVMGGYLPPLGPGMPPWGVDADWNVQSDTLAARVVFSRCDPILVTVNATVRAALRAWQLSALRASGPLGRLIARQSELYAADERHHDLARRHAGLPDDLLNFQHDALACAVALGWDGATVDTMPLVAGPHDRWLAFTPAGDGKPIRIVTRADSSRFEADWLRSVEDADRLREVMRGMMRDT